MMLLIFIFATFTFAHVNCLECAIDSGVNITELQMVLNECMYKPKSFVKEITEHRNLKKGPSSTEYDSDYDESSYSYINDDDSVTETPTSTIKTTKLPTKKVDSSKAKNKYDGFEEIQHETTTETNYPKVPMKPGRCTFHCIFKKLEIVDNEGYPDHEKVSKNLIKNTENNEIKDFFQDSIDECFQLTQEQSDHLDVCDFSLNLSKCLAEKARSNCADFPIGDTPFSTMF